MIRDLKARGKLTLLVCYRADNHHRVSKVTADHLPKVSKAMADSSRLKVNMDNRSNTAGQADLADPADLSHSSTAVRPWAARARRMCKDTSASLSRPFKRSNCKLSTARASLVTRSSHRSQRVQVSR